MEGDILLHAGTVLPEHDVLPSVRLSGVTLMHCDHILRWAT